MLCPLEVTGSDPEVRFAESAGSDSVWTTAKQAACHEVMGEPPPPPPSLLISIVAAPTEFCPKIKEILH